MKILFGGPVTIRHINKYGSGRLFAGMSFDELLMRTLSGYQPDTSRESKLSGGIRDAGTVTPIKTRQKEVVMKIALINENSQAAKNELIEKELKAVALPLGHEVINIGMFNAEDAQLTYVQNGILASLLLDTKTVDFVVTGCGTGEGAMLACNAMPGVVCGHVTSPLDAYLFGQVNGGNAIAMPFAQGFGWGAELNLRYTFEKLLAEEFGGGYPKERAIPEQRNARILNEVKKVSHRPLLEVLKGIDRELLIGAVNRPSFTEFFFANCPDAEIVAFLKSVLA